MIHYKNHKHAFPIVAILMIITCLCSCSNHEKESPSNLDSPKPLYEADPMNAKIVTSDIELFWDAFDQLMQDSSSNPFQKDYIEKASQGVIDFLPNKRIVSAEALQELVLSEKEYYANIKTSSFRSMEYEKQIRATYFALKHLYPKAEFPTLYFIIGRTTSGATATQNGLVVGIETFSDTLYETVYGRPSLDLDLLPFIVAHEIIHFLQVDDTTNNSLLKNCIREGSADFIAEMTSGEKVKLMNGTNVYPYGDLHEEKLWNEFKGVMKEDEIAPWLYSQTKDGRPQNLGYWMGYKIVEAYYNKAQNKKAAISDILNIEDYDQFLITSGYQEKFE